MLAPNPAKPMPRRARWTIGAGLALYVLAAAASGFDRAVPDNRAFAAWLPSFARSSAEGDFARREIEAGIAGSALAPARLAVAANPADPASTADLGAALLARGKAREADAAFRVSAELGWRDPLTQLYWLRVAAAQGDWRNAGHRFDALARQFPGAPAVAQAAALLEAQPQGQTELARRIAEGAPWSASFATLDQAVGTTRLDRRGDTLLAAASFGRRLGCDNVAGIVRALAASDPMRAAALWRAHCPDGGAAGAVADGGLDRIRMAGQRTPFEWDLSGHGSIDAVLVAAPQGGGQDLRLESSAPAAMPVLSQMVALAPGSYRVTWRARPAGRIRASLACRRDTAALPDTAPGEVAIAVDGSCPARWLQLWLTPGVGTVTLSEVSIERR